MPAVPRPASATACSAIDAMPCRSMSFIVKTWTPESRTAIFSRSSRLRTPMSTVCVGKHLGREAADPRELRRLLAEQRRQRHAVHVAAQRRRRRVHVAVRVDPQQADRQVRCVCLAHSARGADRSGAEAVIAAEHERDRALGERRERRLVQLRADLRDVADVFLALVMRLPGSSPESASADRLCPRPCGPTRRAARPVRRCGTPTVPCRRRGDCRQGRGERR